MFNLQRLNFKMPDFTRVSWASDGARRLWEPRIARIGQCWRDLELLSVVTGQRRCAQTIIPAYQLDELVAKMESRGLHVAITDSLGEFRSTYATLTTPDNASDRPANYRVVVGTDTDIAAYQIAWVDSDQAALGELLGYPACCTEFFNRVWYGERIIDPTWAIAFNTNPDLVELQEDGQSAPQYVCPIQPDTFGNAVGTFAGNILLRWLGVRVVPHLPCSFSCEHTLANGEQYLALGRNAGYMEEIDWLVDMLNWPIQWTALHGIAEIKTPVLKISTTTDATAIKYIVQYHGNHYPEEGVSGLGFPYQQPTHRKVTDSKAFQRGLSQPITLEE